MNTPTLNNAFFEKEPVAIVGIGSLFPDANKTEEFWNNIVNKRYSIQEVPIDRWDPALYYSEDHSIPDKTYSKIGGFVKKFDFNPIDYRIPPKVIPQIDLVQQFALFAAKEALEDANFRSDTFPNESCAVIIGNSMGGDRKTDMDLRVLFPKVTQSLKISTSFKKLNKTQQATMLRELEDNYKKEMTVINEDSMPGELSNVISGRIAATFNLRGKSMTSDAACASSLAAIDDAYKGLLTHEFDAVVVGGSDRSLMPTTFVKFSKIGALSNDGSYPFDERANGFVQGEGAGMMVLKRLSDAKKAGDKIYALMIGIGASSDGKGKGITAPNPIGQELALKRAFENSGIDASDIQLVEAHGTSTKVGDRVEVNVLNKVFAESNLPKASVMLGSIKSQIGHLKSAAGAAGLIKTVLALHHKILPPSINFKNANPNIEWEKGPLKVNTEAREWKTDGSPRRASVSSFGFGGTNYVVILEEYNPNKNYSIGTPIKRINRLSYSNYVNRNKELMNEAILLSANSIDEFQSNRDKLLGIKENLITNKQKDHLIDQLRELNFNRSHKFRIGLTYKTFDELDQLSSMAIDAIKDASKRKMVQARGVFVSEGLKAGKISFVFPGQGSQYADMLLDLSKKFSIVEETFKEADVVLKEFLDKPLSDYIFSKGRDVKEINEGLRQTQITQPAMLTADIAIFRLLNKLNINPDMVAGHSLGEYAALVAAGVLSFEDALMAVAIRGKAMSEVDVKDKGAMAAISGKFKDISKILDEVDGYCIAANKNSHSSTVISGSTAGVEEAVKLFVSKGMKAIKLSVSAAFHTKIVEPAGKPLAKFLDKIKFNKPKIPITSNVTGDFFPENPDKIRDLMKKQVKSAVEWTEQILHMEKAGSTVFFEVGPKKALSNFVSDILKDKAIAVACNHPKKGGIKTINEAIAAGAAIGLDIPQLFSDSDIFHEEFRWTHLIPQQYQELASVSRPISDINRGDFSAFIDKTLEYLDNEVGKINKMGLNLDNLVVTGVGIGLPGIHKEIFDENNFDRLMRGENFIDKLPTSKLDGQLDKNIRRLIKKPSGDAEFFTPKSYKDVISLAGQAGKFDLTEEFDINPRIAETYDNATELAIASGLLALRDAGIPLVRAYKKTSTGSFLPGDWELPVDLQDETGVIFASAFPGFNKFANELTTFNKKRFDEKSKRILNNLYSEVSRRLGSEHDKKYLLNKLENELLLIDQEEEEYTFNRKILLEVLSMGHAQFAQLIKARGPNTQINAACASTTQAVGIANDWIRMGRCKRVIVISADNITSDDLFEWLGSGFLATGAAAIKDRVEDAALPFDRRRDGMIIGMGAAALVVETSEEAKRRGVEPIVEVMGTFYSNSAYHGTRLDVNHVSSELSKFMARMEKQHGIVSEEIARSMMFMSHETYTPRRGGSAAAEIKSLRDNFGRNANEIHIANTKGFTGHAMGAGIEDAVAIKTLEKGVIPPIANFKEADPDLGDLKLSKGGKVNIEYALRLAAGFGSQVAFALYRKGSSGDRFGAGYDEWLAQIGGNRSDLYLKGKSYRLKDRGAGNAITRKASEKNIVRSNIGSRKKPIHAVRKELNKVIKTPVKVDRIVSKKPVSKPEKSSGGPSKDELEKVLIDHIVESTGYPRESVSADLELEADLGIDSVKIAEIFGAIREQYGLEEDGELNLADYPTIDKMAEYFSDRMGSVSAQTVNIPSVSKSVSKSIPKSITETSHSVSKAELQKVLIDHIVESTGYPRESVSADLELEADLGIDSVKIAEIFGAIREQYGLEEDGELNLADYPTIDKMAEYFSDRMSSVNVLRETSTTEVVVTSSDIKGSISKAELQDVLIDHIVESTGYPRESVSADLELEADLGIDSVKIAEIFGAIREQYGLEEDGELNLADYPTIDKMAEYFSDRMGSVSAQTVNIPSVSKSVSKSIPKSITETSHSVSKAELQEVLIDHIVESTGYPRESVSADLELEADLGIDSVKIAEIFGAIREQYGLEEDGELNLADYPTIDKMAEYFSDRMGSANLLSKTQSTGIINTSTVSKEELVNTLIEEIARTTGYPKHMIEADVDLEETLGVDSVKVSEVFTIIADKFGFEKDMTLNIGDYPTINDIATYFTTMDNSQVKSKTVKVSSRKLVKSDSLIDNLINFVAEITETPVSLIGEYVSIESDLGFELSSVYSAIEEEFNLSAGSLSGDTIGEIFKSMNMKDKVSKVSLGDKSRSKSIKDTVFDIISAISGMPVTMIDEYVSLSDDLGMNSKDIQQLKKQIKNVFGVKIDELSIIKDVLDKLSGSTASNSVPPKPVAKEQNITKVDTSVIKSTDTKTHRYVIRSNKNDIVPMKYSAKGILFARKNAEISKLAGDMDLELKASLKKDTKIDKNTTLLFFNPTEKSQGKIDSIFTLIKENLDNINRLILVSKVNKPSLLSLSAYQGALGGMFKALEKEFEHISCKIIVVEELSQIKNEIMQKGTEVYYNKNQRYELALSEEDLRATNSKLPENATVLVSGGAQGITFETIRSIANKGNVIFLIGRTIVRDDAAEYSELNEEELERRKWEYMDTLKKTGKKVTPVILNKEFAKITKSAKVYENIEVLRELGVDVIYVPMDVSDEKSVKDGFDSINKILTSISRTIDHFIHGAGMEISRPSKSKSLEEFQMVYNIKTKGMELLLDQMELDELKRVIVFSSVAGRFGNATQVDYSAANEYLAKRCFELREKKINATVIDWSAWADIGMATRGSTMKVLQSLGVTAIPLEEGIDRFRSEFFLSDEPEVVISGSLGRMAQSASWYVPDYKKGIMIDEIRDLSSIRNLSISKDKYLDDHRIDGKAVLPGVMGMETMAETVRAYTGKQTVIFQDVAFRSPVKLSRDNDLEITTELKNYGELFGLKLKSKFMGPDGKQLGDLREHFEAKIITGKRIPGYYSPVNTDDKLMEKADIYKIFFHGSSYQVLASLNKLSNNSAIATFSKPRKTMFGKKISLEINPLNIEAAFQAAGLHLLMTRKIMGLPSAIRSIHLFKEDKPVKYLKVYHLQSNDTHSLYDVLLINENNICVAQINGYEMVHTGSVDIPDVTIEEDDSIATVRNMIGNLEPKIFTTDIVESISEDFIDKFLNKTEKSRFSSIKVSKKRSEWIAGRISAKSALSYQLKIPLNKIEIFKDDNKSPYTIFENQIQHVSISHSNGIAMAIYGDRAVDVEKVASRDKSFVQQMFSEDERASLSLDTDVQITKYWSIKEAHLKRMRIGLKTDVRSVNITDIDDENALVESEQGTSVCHVKISDEWIVTIADKKN